MDILIKDSILIQKFIESSENNNLTLEDIKYLTPFIKNYDLIIKFYNNIFLFNNEELLELCSYLHYLQCSRILWILLIMKTTNLVYFRSRINNYLINDFDNIYLEKNLFISSILYGYFNLSEFLIEKYKEDINFALTIAIKKSNKKLVDLLLNNGANVDDYCLKLAFKNNHLDIFDNLIKYIDDYSKILLWACENGFMYIIKKLMEYNIYPDNEIYIIKAKLNNHTEIVEFLDINFPYPINYFINKNIDEYIKLINIVDNKQLTTILIAKFKIIIKEYIYKINEKFDINMNYGAILSNNPIDIFKIINIHLNIVKYRLPEKYYSLSLIEIDDILKEERENYLEKLSDIIQEFDIEKICTLINDNTQMKSFYEKDICSLNSPYEEFDIEKIRDIISDNTQIKFFYEKDICILNSPYEELIDQTIKLFVFKFVKEFSLYESDIIIVTLKDYFSDIKKWLFLDNFEKFIINLKNTELACHIEVVEFLNKQIDK